MSRCGIHSLGRILRCMTNFHRFVFTLIADINISLFIMNLTIGELWYEILINHVPCLKKFDFHISWMNHGRRLLGLDNILNSFTCLINLYHQWDMYIAK